MKRLAQSLVNFLFCSLRDDIERMSFQTKQLYGIFAILTGIALTSEPVFVWWRSSVWLLISWIAFWLVVSVIFIFGYRDETTR